MLPSCSTMALSARVTNSSQSVGTSKIAVPSSRSSISFFSKNAAGSSPVPKVGR